MSYIDWLVLVFTLAFIVIYGIWKTRGSRNIEGFLKGDNSDAWWRICLSIMATQASAITFLSTPGQAYEDGMRFLQFYFGLPLAMVIISVTFIPIFYRLKVYTAYEFLENRFDLKTRSLAAFLFLVQRGLSTGISIYAPAIILSSIMGWNINLTIMFIGTVVIIYTVSGGTKAVSVTQTQQMAVMMGGMVLAGVMIVYMLPQDVSFTDAVQVAGHMGKMNMVNFSFDWNDRYNVWSGITAGLFLFMSYFGTDQSQVGRYLSGTSIAQSRIGVLFNGLLKIPMQVLILFIGVLVFVFYQFVQPPVFFNQVEKAKLENSVYAGNLSALEKEHTQVFQEKSHGIKSLLQGIRQEDETIISAAREDLDAIKAKEKSIHGRVVSLLEKADPTAEAKDTDYVFISFVMKYMPVGLVGLLVAVVFSASMSSSASAFNALASTTLVDIYKRSVKRVASETHYLNMSRVFTIVWGLIAIFFATLASRMENLIQAVNILGSIFYGTILGIFVVAFYFKYIKAQAVFWAALLTQTLVIIIYWKSEIGFLWLNPIGCLLVIFFGSVFQLLFGRKEMVIEK
ncbi:sodium:solute symporter [Adhaeribacter sp. BT258]|uniref:Sodium:solute symporter n=1 Tax=Adhaeribacter terrigena TaxID=2793070 RepID=A0ABS1BZZ1_9BACT|nr:sodium:solute symporter [Adhaeribacter terrigena]MBK0402486.1 sodium:solute symporter [Adhaeribacter terrigena]